MKTWLLYGGLLAAVLGFALWYQMRPVAGVDTMGDSDATLAWIGLATSVTGLATSLVTLVATIRKR